MVRDPTATPPEVALGWGRDELVRVQAAEHRAVREAVGVMDMSLMAKFLVQGRDAEARAEPDLRQRRAPCPSAGSSTRSGSNERGGIEADLTVTRLGEERFLVVVTDVIHRRIEPLDRAPHAGRVRTSRSPT